MLDAYLILLGALIGAFGSAVGAGGGFLVVPLLMYLYPDDSIEVVNAIAIAIVFLRSLSAAAAFGRQKRIDYRSGWLFAAATAPFAALGSYAIQFVDASHFRLLLGLALLGLAAQTFFAKLSKPRRKETRYANIRRELIDAEGTRYRYAYRLDAAVASSAVIGFAANFFAVGGGVLRMPALVQWLRFPAHIAVATTQFALVFSSFAGVAVHLSSGALVPHLTQTVYLALGAVAGAQFGAWFAKKSKEVVLMRLLVAALVIIGVQLIMGGLEPPH